METKPNRPDAREWWRNLQSADSKKATAILADPASPPYLVAWAKRTLERLAGKPRPKP
jgi:hypothetical protein